MHVTRSVTKAMMLSRDQLRMLCSSFSLTSGDGEAEKTACIDFTLEECKDGRCSRWSQLSGIFILS